MKSRKSLHDDLRLRGRNAVLPARDAPFGTRADFEAARAGTPREFPRARAMFDTPTVLVIDDDTEALRATTELLEGAGWSVATARHGLDALQQLQGGLRPRAMLVDLQMPVMDGPTFCDICDAEPELAGIARILVTADRGARGLRYRARAVVPKPVNGRALLRALTEEFCFAG